MEAIAGNLPNVVAAYNELYRRLKNLAEIGAEVLVHRSHGDFAPWNCSWSEDGLFVYDWEASQAHDLAFGDAFYYVMAPALEVERKPSAQRTLDSTLRFAQRVALSSPLKECDFRIYLSVWLMRRVGEARFYGEVLELLERKWL